MDTIIGQFDNFKFYDSNFKSNCFTTDDINHFLVKNYYISEHKTNPVSRIIDHCFDTFDIKQIDYLLENSPEVKQELLRSYLQNIHLSISSRTVEKTYKHGYVTVVYTLSSIKEFYHGKQQYLNEELVYEKSYR